MLQDIEQEVGMCVSHSTPLHTPSSSKHQCTSGTICVSNQCKEHRNCI